MKVAELEGAELDYWVAHADGVLREVLDAGHTLKVFHPSTDWQDGGPIIERERISSEPQPDGTWLSDTRAWPDRTIGNGYACETGPTPLVAAMRCYVASKFGEAV